MQEIILGSKRLAVTELVGKGGEGEVYKITSRSDVVVKIYNINKRSEREGKVRAMVDVGLYNKTDLIAYPREIVTDKTGEFLGFAMRFVSGYRPLHELYGPKSRLRHFPGADYRFLVRAALNVARAVGNVHQDGGVIGDLNHSGVLIAQDATVALIDADSFQFYLKGNTYPCVVGVPDFTPPELHGKNLASVKRTINHDNFGLAVAIFHLLLMGRHPYAGRYNGPDISMSEAIAQNRFAFSLKRQNATQTTPPPGALTLDLFPDVVANAFEQAFGLTPDARPNAIEWIQILTFLESSLNRCSKIKMHFYPNKAKGCVWCVLAANNSFDMFPDQGEIFSTLTGNAYVTERAIKEIQSFHLPTLQELLQTSLSINSPSAVLLESQHSKFIHALLGLLTIGGAVCGFIYLPTIFYVWIGLAIWGGVIFTDRKVDQNKFHQAFKEADELVQHALEAFLRRSGLTEIFKTFENLEITIVKFKGQDAALARDRVILKSTRKARQLRTYLDNFSIRQADISGIGPAKTSTLISFGIETAADVNNTDVLRVPGFGKIMTSKLVEWRRAKEANFTYDQTPNSQDAADEKTLQRQYAVEKAKQEKVIADGLAMLKKAKSALDALPDAAKADKSLSQALIIRAQAEHDLKILGLVAPSSAVSLSIKSSTPQPMAPTSNLSGNAIAKNTPSYTQTISTVPNCPRCGSAMHRRSGKHGQFWGCQNYPRCKGTRN